MAIGLAGSEQAQTQGLQSALSALREGVGFGQEQLLQQQQLGLQGVDQAINQGSQAFDAFVQPGQQAAGIQAAQAGALGPEAQQQAFQNFQNSPGQQFALQQAEQASLRNAGATGGLGGGRVQQELQRQAIGFAQQDFGNQFNRLSQIAGQGLAGAGQQANLRGQQAGLTAGLRGQAGQTLANIGLQAGQTGAGFGFGTGQGIAQARTRAGEQIAGGIQSTTGALSQLANQQGGGLADLIGQGGSNLAQLLQGFGLSDAQSQETLATILANVATGSGSGTQPSAAQFINTTGNLQQFGQLASGIGGAVSAFNSSGGQPGAQPTPPITAPAANNTAGSTIGSVIGAFSDSRLKTNVTQIGHTNGGHKLYVWNWTEQGKKLAGDQLQVGVLAQELLHTLPEAVSVSADGWLLVDYAQVA